MNCHSFSRAAIELARGQLDEQSRLDALAHAQRCPQCAARLAEEESLAAGLRALVASQQQEQAPPRVETALWLAFQQSRPAWRDKRAVGGRRDRSLTLAALWRRQMTPWRWAAAAVAVLLLAVSVSLLKPRTRSQRQPVKAESARMSPAIAAPAHEGSQAVAKAAARRSTGPRRRSKGRERSIPASDSGEEREIAREFLPLPYANTWGLEDSIRIVRGSVPRSALVSLGLPMNAERASEPIKVDLVLGQDGVARAIRFVKQY